MGLHSRFGKQRADELKKLNQRSHAQIFSGDLRSRAGQAGILSRPVLPPLGEANLPKARCRVGINPYSGGRWPSKELRPARVAAGDSPVARRFFAIRAPAPRSFCSAPGQDFTKNEALVARQRTDNLVAICTDESVQHLAAAVAGLDYLISSDSLALHLAIAQNVPFTAFFSPDLGGGNRRLGYRHQGRFHGAGLLLLSQGRGQQQHHRRSHHRGDWRKPANFGPPIGSGCAGLACTSLPNDQHPNASPNWSISCDGLRHRSRSEYSHRT